MDEDVEIETQPIRPKKRDPPSDARVEEILLVFARARNFLCIMIKQKTNMHTNIILMGAYDKR